MKNEEEKRTLLLPVELFQRIEKRVKNTEFGSVDGYIIFVLEEVLREDEETVALSEQEEADVKKRLKDLGYLG